ncbi:MAG: hypothetical protein HXY34_07345 [Candidatus Thorarchaeota archaeon]|nr:hypothetical protein [Candidatus Thorarchaeota archaeon]
MPRKKNSSSKTAVILLLIVVGGLVVVAWHDGLIGATSIESITDGKIQNGAVVTIRGRLVSRLGTLHAVQSLNSDRGLVFIWSGDSPAIDSIVVVHGKVTSIWTLGNVTSLEKVWVFA